LGAGMSRQGWSVGTKGLERLENELGRTFSRRGATTPRVIHVFRCVIGTSTTFEPSQVSACFDSQADSADSHSQKSLTR